MNQPMWEEYITVKDSELHGKGIFSNINIPSNETIMIIDGEVINENECVRREEEEGNVYIFWNGDQYIDSSKKDKIKFINHRCEPNCYIDDRDDNSLYLITQDEIKAGDEITIDYDYEEIYDNCRCIVCQGDSQ
jgi:uncharacterized protein